MIKKGKFYTRRNSKLIVFLKDILGFDEESIKVSTLIFKKSNNDLVEGVKEYTLNLERINNWREL